MAEGKKREKAGKKEMMGGREKWGGERERERELFLQIKKKIDFWYGFGGTRSSSVLNRVQCKAGPNAAPISIHDYCRGFGDFLPMLWELL